MLKLNYEKIILSLVGGRVCMCVWLEKSKIEESSASAVLKLAELGKKRTSLITFATVGHPTTYDTVINPTVF